VLDIERGQLDKLRPIFWQTDTSIGEKSWGYIEGEKFRTTDSLVSELVDIVSKNGTLLLNIGPKSDGTIPEEVEKTLLDLGQWLSVNAEAIYGTRPWKVFGEGPTKVVGGSFKDTAGHSFTAQDVRFTTKGDILYAIALAWPQDGKLTIKSLGTAAFVSNADIKTVELVGSTAQLKWQRAKDGLHIELPAERPCDYAISLKIR
jgi:alpha-L-fucosidase